MYISKKHREAKEISKCYENLANGIIILAVEDYREALKTKNKGEIIALERFFLSAWYSILTNLPGEVIIDKIREECGYRSRKTI